MSAATPTWLLTAVQLHGNEERLALELEGRLFYGGAYGYYRHLKAPRGSAAKRMIELGRQQYDVLRARAGLTPVIDWSQKPDVTFHGRRRRAVRAAGSTTTFQEAEARLSEVAALVQS